MFPCILLEEIIIHTTFNIVSGSSFKKLLLLLHISLQFFRCIALGCVAVAVALHFSLILSSTFEPWTWLALPFFCVPVVSYKFCCALRHKMCGVELGLSCIICSWMDMRKILKRKEDQKTRKDIMLR